MMESWNNGYWSETTHKACAEPGNASNQRGIFRFGASLIATIPIFHHSNIPVAMRRGRSILACLATCVLLAQGVCSGATYYVANTGTNNYPYTNSWADAATNIHAALALAGAGDTVLVTNGSYRLTNTIVVATNLTVRSVNGPDVTTLWRGVANNFGMFLVSNANALVAGFTLTNAYGVAGAAIGMTAGTVSNCVITKCDAGAVNGGLVAISGGLMTRCVISNTAANYGQIWISGSGIMEDSVIAFNSTANGIPVYIYAAGAIVRRCRINNNTAGLYGHGGASILSGKMENSLVYSNTASGGVGYSSGVNLAGGSMVNCTVSGNVKSGVGTGDGVYRTGGAITNCVIYGNGANIPGDNYDGLVSACWYSCAPELTNSAQSNVTANPLFVNAAGADYRLAVASPCVDSGTNLAAITNDIDGTVRPLAGDSRGLLRHDMGAYEKNGAVGSLAAGFAGSPLAGLNSVTSVLTAVCTGTNTTIAWWGWDFNNDGSYERSGAGLAVVTNTFGPGRYSISVRVTNDVGETASSTNLNYVLVASSNIYVSTNGGNVLPYATWENAATNLNDAVDVALAGCAVYVSNGSYRVTKKLDLYSGFTVRSMNGPQATTVWRDAAAGVFGIFDVRDANALVTGFTITNGYLSTGGYGSAINLTAGTVSNCVITKCSKDNPGGIVCVSGGRVTSCLVSNNSTTHGNLDVTAPGLVEDSVIAYNSDGNVGVIRLMSGTIRRCRIFSNTGLTWSSAAVYINGGQFENGLVCNNTQPLANSRKEGSGVYMSGGSMVNCTVASNSAPNSIGDGVYRTGGAITNCIIYGNGSGAPTENYNGAVGGAWYSCAPELTNAVQGNLASDPWLAGLATGDFHPRFGSLCVDSGTNLAAITNDIDGTTRPLAGDSRGLMRHDMGAYEKNGAAGPLAVGFFASPLAGLNLVTSVFTAVVSGTNTTIAWWGWDFDNNGVFDTNGVGLQTVTNVFGPGRYSISVRVTNSVGEAAACTNLNYVLVVSTNIYVSTNGGNVLPYANWGNAATNLNDAVDLALAGCTVSVSNGNYRITKKLDVFTGFTVRSVNGPQVTTVWRDTNAGLFGLFDLRDANALVTGLTLTNGDLTTGGSGSAINLTAGTVSNCVITKCNKYDVGGVVCVTGGRVTSCIVSNNSSSHGNLDVSGSGIVEDSVIAYNTDSNIGVLWLRASTIRRCRIFNNSGGTWSSAALYLTGGQIVNSLVCNNTQPLASSRREGSGVYMAGGSMVNCTVASNSAPNSIGDGVYRMGGAITNCIIYGNGSGAPTENYNGAVGGAWYSCAPELTAGVQGNITATPMFTEATNGNFRLKAGSPCINAGTNQAWMFPPLATAIDLDGNRRIFQGVVDMGAYEARINGTVLIIR